MSSQEEREHEAKLATIMEPYQKAGINTDCCTLSDISGCIILFKDFEKIQKFLHYLLKEGIFPQLMARACEKGIISSASSLNPDEIWNLNTWLKTKEGQTSIQEEFNIRKLKRKAAKRLQEEISSRGNEMVQEVNDAAQNAVKRARMLETEGTSS